MNKHIIYIVLLLLVTSCSTTKNLSEGQVLYTGQKKMIVKNESKSRTGDTAMEEVEAALAKAPNNSFFGSSTMRTPFPFGLWVYNSYVKSEKKLGKWIFNKFAADPVYISTVNPELRVKAATNILHDYGFFNGKVEHEVIPDKKNGKKAKIQYSVDMKNPYFLDSIEYRGFTEEAMKIISRAQGRSQIRKGDQFNVVALDAERQRLSTIFRNVGYYYFQPELIGLQADTTRVSGLVDLRIMPKAGIPATATRTWNIGDVSVFLFGVDGELPNDSIHYKDISIHFHNKLKVRPKVLYDRLRFMPGQRYSQRRATLTQERIAELGIFRYSEIQFTPRDTTETNNILNANIHSRFDYPYNSELELNLSAKSNDYAGPGIAYSVTKKNVFKGGETFRIGVNGSYEWQTKTPAGGSSAKINSWEIGLNSSLSFPKVVFPRLGKKKYDFPATTTFSLNIDQLNRAHFFKMLSFGGEAAYVFQPTTVSKHSVSPFRLTFSTLQETTAEFDTILDSNKALAKSMENQFIPAMSYTYTYDDSQVRRRRNRFWWQSSLTSAGNITSGIYSLFGKGFNDQKVLLGATMAQFIKLTSEARYTWVIDRNQSIATRLMGGLIYSYGYNKIAPYREQFFIGGANSIRAFTVRSIGPGTYVSDPDSKYGYLDQTGDIKLEANIEYRFRIIKDLHGAIFADAGNVWLLRENTDVPGGKFTLKDFGNNIALGTGAGLRYDLSFLVVRLDCGVALHTPYKTTKSGYYNIPKFSDGLGFHFAIGYPF